MHVSTRPTLLAALLAGLAVFSAAATAHGGMFMADEEDYAPIMQQTPLQTAPGTVMMGSTVVSVASTTALFVGESVSGMGIPPGATIVSIVDPTFYILSVPAISSGSSALAYGAVTHYPALGIAIKYVRLEEKSAGHTPPPPGTPVQVSSFFDIYTDVSQDGGLTWSTGLQVPNAAAWMNVLAGTPSPPYVDLLTEEVTSLQMSGGGLPAGVMIRESPTTASPGVTKIQAAGGAAGGGYYVDSFFDIFTEASVDGGQTWYPASSPVRVEAVPEPATLALLAVGGLCALAYVWRRRVRAA